MHHYLLVILGIALIASLLTAAHRINRKQEDDILRKL